MSDLLPAPSALDVLRKRKPVKLRVVSGTSNRIVDVPQGRGQKWVRALSIVERMSYERVECLNAANEVIDVLPTGRTPQPPPDDGDDDDDDDGGTLSLDAIHASQKVVLDAHNAALKTLVDALVKTVESSNRRAEAAEAAQARMMEANATFAERMTDLVSQLEPADAPEEQADDDDGKTLESLGKAVEAARDLMQLHQASKADPPATH